MNLDAGAAALSALSTQFFLLIPAAAFFFLVAGGLWNKARTRPSELGRWLAGWAGAAATLTSAMRIDPWSAEHFYRLAMLLVGYGGGAYVLGYVWRLMRPLGNTPELSATAALPSATPRKTVAVVPITKSGSSTFERAKPLSMEQAYAEVISTPIATAQSSATSDNSPPGSALNDLQAQHNQDLHDKLFDVIGEEIETGRLVRSTWTEAYAEADGDDRRARAIYINLRLARLKRQQADSERLRVELEQARNERAALLTLERASVGPNATEMEEQDGYSFRRLVRAGNLSAVESALAANPNLVFLRTPEHRSMLFLAVEERQHAMAALLVKQGAWDWPDEQGRTALAFARSAGDAALIDMLMAAQPTASASYDDAIASRARGRGSYRGHTVEILASGNVRVVGGVRLFSSVREAVDAIDVKLGTTSHELRNANAESPDRSAPAKEARSYGLTDEQIEYLNEPIMAIHYLKKYSVSKEVVSEAVSLGKLRGAMCRDVLWVEDKPIYR